MPHAIALQDNIHCEYPCQEVPFLASDVVKNALKAWVDRQQPPEFVGVTPVTSGMFLFFTHLNRQKFPSWSAAHVPKRPLAPLKREHFQVVELRYPFLNSSRGKGFRQIRLGAPLQVFQGPFRTPRKFNVSGYFAVYFKKHRRNMPRVASKTRKHE
jgi:hypothetical protein